ncbi:MAG: hypothetical protein ABEI78_01170 [Candidatus Nanohaloarchaea archaeon]
MSYEDIIEHIIQKEKDVIGPVAVKKADSVDGLEVDDDGNIENLDGDGKEVLSDLVETYKTIVGKSIASVLREEKDSEEDLPELPENIKQLIER